MDCGNDCKKKKQAKSQQTQHNTRTGSKSLIMRQCKRRSDCSVVLLLWPKYARNRLKIPVRALKALVDIAKKDWQAMDLDADQRVALRDYDSDQEDTQMQYYLAITKSHQLMTAKYGETPAGKQ
ncbi:unnamed protein product [Polarella glacialis]|uniref:Uncharacterized protein n=1 Tax=Polarella glacialis TaxID=89957 RepID=A0A813LNY5_POLGL|nr:unnamed protein product [Polarella glacialis]